MAIIYDTVNVMESINRMNKSRHDMVDAIKDIVSVQQYLKEGSVWTGDGAEANLNALGTAITELWRTEQYLNEVTYVLTEYGEAKQQADEEQMKRITAGM